jgi:hypothetical protein
LEWIPGAGVLGAVLVLLIVPPFALIGLAVVAFAAVAAVVAFVGALLATPYLVVRAVRRRFAERQIRIHELLHGAREYGRWSGVAEALPRTGEEP